MFYVLLIFSYVSILGSIHKAAQLFLRRLSVLMSSTPMEGRRNMGRLRSQINIQPLYYSKHPNLPRSVLIAHKMSHPILTHKIRPPPKISHASFVEEKLDLQDIKSSLVPVSKSNEYLGWYWFWGSRDVSHKIQTTTNQTQAYQLHLLSHNIIHYSTWSFLY